MLGERQTAEVFSVHTQFVRPEVVVVTKLPINNELAQLWAEAELSLFPAYEPIRLTQPTARSQQSAEPKKPYAHD